MHPVESESYTLFVTDILYCHPLHTNRMIIMLPVPPSGDH